MKKVAIFVEGQTEQIFINKLIKEIAGQKRVSIVQYKLQGGRHSPNVQLLIGKSIKFNSNYHALIYDCGGDEKVKSDILDRYKGLVKQGFSLVIGLRDLYPMPYAELDRLTKGMRYIPAIYKPLIAPINFIIAVMEVETWFLAEHNHYKCIDEKLTMSLIKSEFGFDPANDNMEKQRHPASDLNQIYRLANRAYSKRKAQIHKITNCLDYKNYYFNLKHKYASLGQLISLIDDFLE